MDKTTLKRILRYARKSKTTAHNKWLKGVDKEGRSGNTAMAEGQWDAWCTITDYLEVLLREVEDAQEAE